MSRATTLAAVFAACTPLAAHEVITTKITWSREVSRIVYARCLSCHREGGTAFSLATYAEARPWAKAIQEEVLNRRMPPWNAVKGFGQFQDDRGLTQEELSLIAEWVDGGAPEGNPLYLPDRPRLRDSPTPDSGRAIAFSGSTVLARKVEALGIRVTSVPASRTLQVIAIRPDSSIEPLVWVRKSNSADPGVYRFRRPLALPAGTKLQTMPAEGSAALVVR